MNSLTSVNQSDFFRQATLHICGSLNPDAAFKRLLDYLKDIIPAEGISLGLIDAEESTITLLAWASVREAKRPPSTFTVSEQFRGKLKQLRAEKDPFILMNDTETTRAWREYFVPMGWWDDGCSKLTMKIDLNGQRIGGMTLWAGGENRYTQAHIELLSMLHEPIAIALSNAIQHEELLRMKEILADDNQYLQQALMHISGDTIIGGDGGLREVMEMVRLVAATDTPVLLLGETGVGKEVIANFIQQSSPRNGKAFIKVNCGALPEGLMDSELFGHEKGAFTGAVAQRRGCFERARGGAIFLDEIGELSPGAQVRLLRVLQTKEIERVGGTAPIRVDVRIIAATHRDLQNMVKQGRFREDLWYRLNVFPIMIPPLRQRKMDIPLLVNHFVGRKSIAMKIPSPPALKSEALGRLMAYDWPGNVRELENSIERALIRSLGGDLSGTLNFSEIMASKEDSANGSGWCYREDDLLSFDDMCRSYFKRALKISQGRIEGPRGAAERLKLKPNTLRAKMRKLGVLYGRG